MLGKLNINKKSIYLSISYNHVIKRKKGNNTWDSFEEIVNYLEILYDKGYKRLSHIVDDIISNNITNISAIEIVLDELLCCYDKKYYWDFIVK